MVLQQSRSRFIQYQCWQLIRGSVLLLLPSVLYQLFQSEPDWSSIKVIGSVYVAGVAGFTVWVFAFNSGSNRIAEHQLVIENDNVAYCRYTKKVEVAISNIRSIKITFNPLGSNVVIEGENETIQFRRDVFDKDLLLDFLRSLSRKSGVTLSG